MNEIERAVDVLKKGGLAVYPTDTLYAVGAIISNENAVKKVYEIKKRPLNIYLPVAVGSVEQIESVAVMNDVARKIAEKFMPGPITLILKKKKEISNIVAREKIAVRVPANPVALKISSLAGAITATSANVHGRNAPSTVEEAEKQLGNKVDIYVDGGKLKGIPSTIIDVSDEKIKVIREGAIKTEEFYE
ncbi:MAG: threonylcarbamoyl-AMP synthase [Thermoplasmata archaeon]|nr:threonylcarbamoyl-AMP synthase [Thermoplasmata archaeon]